MSGICMPLESVYHWRMVVRRISLHGNLHSWVANTRVEKIAACENLGIPARVTSTSAPAAGAHTNS